MVEPLRARSGFLEVGTNDNREVVVNLPCDMTGHIVFSPTEAFGFASMLQKMARRVVGNICGDVGSARDGRVTVVCMQQMGHAGNHGGMGCEW